MTKKIEEFDEEFDDSDLGYDRWVEGIICSDDFEKCEMKDSENNCLVESTFTEYKIKGKKEMCRTRCWHIQKCPLGKARI